MEGRQMPIRNSSALLRVWSGLLSLPVLLTLGCEPGARTTANVEPPRNERVEPAVAGPDALQPALPLMTMGTVLVTDRIRSEYREAIELLEAGQYEPGIALLREVTEQVPDLADAHVDLGIAYARTEDLENAEASLTEALKLNPHQPVAYNELGMVQRRKGELSQARESYEAALAEAPDFSFAHRNLAVLCDVYFGDYPCALEHYLAYNQLTPEDAEVSRWIADLRQRGIGVQPETSEFRQENP
jgi:tetratricopeptide (TPR) repeat protein